MLVWACRRAWLAGPALAMAISAGGCVAPVVVGAAGTTAVKASEERGLSGALSNVQIQARINELWFKQDLDLYQRIHLTVDQGRVMLTGRAANPDQRVDAVRLVWQVQDVTEVINEIAIDNQSSLVDSARDSWIATQLRTALILDQTVHSTNYSIDVVNGVVYLMGVAHGQQELDRVIGHAKELSRVQGVVPHVRVL